MIRLLLIFTFICINSRASNFDIEKYQKCHKQFTNTRIDTESEIINLIKQKKISAAKACIKIIQEASFNKNFQLKKISKRTKTILKNFQTLHNSWFKLFNLNRETQDHAATNVVDTNQMAYHFTASLLSENYPYSNIFSTQITFAAIREGNEENLFSNDKDIGGTRSRIDGTGSRKWQIGGVEDGPRDYGSRYYWNPPLVEFGELTGLKPITDHLYFKRLKEGKTLDKTALTRSLFPGVFGSVAYLILNLGHDNQTTDGGNKLHRRFANNLFNDFLCRDLPILKKEDVKIIKESKISFRKKKNCMSCHMTMDQLALATTHLEAFNAGEIHFSAFTFRSVYKHSTSMSSTHQFVDKDKDFYKKRHMAKFYFRDFKGDLVNRKISEPKDIGQILKTLDDPYLCTTKRYFEFLTGIEVDINNFKNIPNDSNIKKTLLKLTSVLKNEQSPKRLIEEIISSRYYLTKNREGSYE
ncbi:hypothetical protein BIY24_07360 [Halobacteriovorax marinus]|uniref:hypothetical protein n=1 Tax=Halobacteriovorax marinus TaxID=97084 RepID=UPI000BC327A6|nr:hypothetical protein [Halobacteriovorax marinus]ATH07770.1 hypothetical protein BIY24_07360 [Halobacteriovorax marinus]